MEYLKANRYEWLQTLNGGRFHWLQNRFGDQKVNKKLEWNVDKTSALSLRQGRSEGKSVKRVKHLVKRRNDGKVNGKNSKHQ